ncbi:MAG: glycosyltransferase involved in cell wall biosynthesis [Paracoccaceae bacterium]|jgi:glycosyltransferase involved in cell wall biosynthesis
MTAPRFSIVMPCFNAGSLATEAIRSLQRQSVADWEMIVVDDGSSDGSHAVAEDWALVDPRIRLAPLAHNRGAAFARNVGIAHARGDYVCFLDADDVLIDDALAAFAKAIGDGAPDLVKGQIAVTHDDGDPIRTQAGQAFAVENAETLRGRILALSDFTTHAYRRGFLDDCHIRFEEDLIIGEDRIFLARAQLWCRDFVATDRVVYVYRKQNSVTLEGEWSGAKQLSLMAFLTTMRSLIDSRPQAERLRAAFFLSSFPWQCRLLARTARVADRGRVIAHAETLRAAAVSGVDVAEAFGQRFIQNWPPLAHNMRRLLEDQDWDAVIWAAAVDGQTVGRAA